MKMKKNLYAMLAGSALLAACQTAPQQTALKGELTGVESDTLIVNYFAVNDFSRQNVKHDTIALQQGKFSYTLPTDSVPTEVWLYAKPVAGMGYDMRANTQVLLFPGQTITLTGELKGCTASGSKFHEELAAVVAQQKPIRVQLDSVGNLLTKLQNEKAPQEEIQKLYTEQYKPLANQQKEVYVKYIREHLNSDASLYLLSQLGLKESKELLPQLDAAVKAGPLASLYKRIDAAIQRDLAFEEAKKNVAEGKPAPDFTLTDINGKPFTLSSLRGKYVVLDFWGSWCGWCIKGMPEMKKYYAKYQNKLEIVGIDCRDTEEKWKDAVKRHELPWLNVRNDDATDATLLYAVNGFPTKIVIDPEGNINKIVIGEDPAFYKHLDQLFK